jgi:hypothetical protein
MGGRFVVPEFVLLGFDGDDATSNKRDCYKKALHLYKIVDLLVAKLQIIFEKLHIANQKKTPEF